MYDDTFAKNTSANIATGLYRGIVENNNDPYKIGRLQVRIPAFHGVPGVTESAITTDGLPWASVCSMSAGSGRGTSIKPMMGDIVWVMFEDGRKDTPVVIGSSFGTGSFGGASTTTMSSTGKMFGGDLGGASSTGSPKPADPSPKDSNQILYRSPKGAEISFNEEDSAESFNMIDRVGQVIKMVGPAPSGARGRTTGDREDPTSLPSDNSIAHGNGGYILLQSTSSDFRDSKIRMTERDTKIQNGQSWLHMENGKIQVSNRTLREYQSAQEREQRDKEKYDWQIEIDGDKVILRNSTCSLTMDGDNVDLKNSGCQIKMSGGEMTITASHIQMTADRIDLN